jgi:hypothetical protein
MDGLTLSICDVRRPSLTPRASRFGRDICRQDRPLPGDFRAILRGPARTAGEEMGMKARIGATQWPTVAVVVPTRDRPALLERAIRSIMGQSYPGNIDCVVVFDSRDDQHAKPWAGRCP